MAHAARVTRMRTTNPRTSDVAGPARRARHVGATMMHIHHDVARPSSNASHSHPALRAGPQRSRRRCRGRGRQHAPRARRPAGRARPRRGARPRCRRARHRRPCRHRPHRSHRRIPAPPGDAATHASPAMPARPASRTMPASRATSVSTAVNAWPATRVPPSLRAPRRRARRGMWGHAVVAASSVARRSARRPLRLPRGSPRQRSPELLDRHAGEADQLP
jgi:hypothetical protein